MDHLKKTIKNLPHAPGVYLYKDDSGLVLYVGKAKNLYRRVHEYFRSPNTLPDKTRALVAHIASISVHTVATEFDALLLEAKYIRFYAPKYNIIAKDDKSPIYIRIQKNDVLPRIALSRKPKIEEDTDARYFGPFHSTREALRLLRRLRASFPFCQQKKRNGTPCFYSHLGLCRPCPSSIESLPEGNEKKNQIRIYRKNIRNISFVLSGKSKTVMVSMKKEIRSLSDKERFEEAAVVRDQLRTLSSTIEKPYHPFFYEDIDALERTPRAQRTHLQTVLRQWYPSLQSLHRIECFDASTLQGNASVGSCVVFIDGIASTNLYRRFTVRSSSARSDDRRIAEIIERRLSHTEWPYPELIIVDGGQTQVSAARTILIKHCAAIPIIGLAKRSEHIIIPTEDGWKTCTLPFASQALQLIQRLRDEAHRFAIAYHRKVRKKIFLAGENLV